MSTCNFFQEGSEQSLVKSEIVRKYFWAWANVMIRNIKKYNKTGTIAYIDLFAGPGRYENGTQSTPLLILSQAIKNTDMCKHLATLFNDGDCTHAKCLDNAIKGLEGISHLKHPPVVYNEEVGDNIVKMFEKMNLVPTFFFVDPWGYKGLSLRLINSVLKDWGCDCVFFFNYNRINMGITNPAVEEHMNALFGTERASYLRVSLENMSSKEREATIVNELALAIKDHGEGRYVLPFCFKDNAGKRTKHHLIFVTKHFLGYEIMKEIMAKESSANIDEVPSFTYYPAKPEQAFLYQLTRPIEDLGAMLLKTFAGKTLTTHDIYMKHNVGTPYILRNYKKALSSLEEAGSVSTSPPATKRKKNTFSKDVKVTFPSLNP